MRDTQRNNPKFTFLSVGDPYYAFYHWRIEEIRAGRGSLLNAGRAQAAMPAATPDADKPVGPKEPPEFKFSARMPTISAQDLDIVRLTALFTAKHGRSFLTPLSQREARNFQFDFLRPNHSLYGFFSRLVDQYTELLRPKGGPTVEELERNVNEKFHILEKSRARADWTRFQTKQREKKEEEQDQERLAYAQVDWHDFVVVETVVFTEADDQTDLLPPTSLNDLQHASLEQKAMMSLHPGQRRIEEAMPDDTIPASYYDPHDGYGMDSMDMSGGGYGPSVTQTTTAMKIRENVPRAMAKRASTVATGICPNCSQSIPLSEMAEHMRIELLDPRWKEQRARADAKFATTNLNTSDTVQNLKRLASQRDDLFDGSPGGENFSHEERERRKKVTAQGWDGSAETREGVRMQSFDVAEQLKVIHRKAGQFANPEFGPKKQ